MIRLVRSGGMVNADKHQGLTDLGTCPLNTAQKSSAIQFVGQLYGSSDCSSLNDLRCSKAEKNVSAKKLPPTEDSFHLHLLRCVYQLVIWRECNTGMCDRPRPLEYGWEEDDSQMYTPKMMSQSTAAPELLNNLVCDCETCSADCRCCANDQPCTEACSCEGTLPGLSDEADGRYCSNR